MKKAILTMTVLLSATLANAETTFQVNGKTVSKLEAYKASMAGQKVFKVQEVALTDKMTFKAVKKVKE